MPPYREPRASQTRAQDLIRRIHRDVLARAQGILDRSDARMNQSLTRELESTQRLLDPGPFLRSVARDHIK